MSNSEMHLRRARMIEDPSSAIAEYMLAIEESVRELAQTRRAMPAGRRR